MSDEIVQVQLVIPREFAETLIKAKRGTAARDAFHAMLGDLALDALLAHLIHERVS